MPRRFSVELELPDEVAERLRGQDVSAKAKEALIMELLREHHLSQGKAAELLGLRRIELFPLMSKYQVPAIEMSPEELRSELDHPFPE